MERASRFHPACTGALLERSGPLTASCGRRSRRSLRRHRQGAGVLRGRAQQAGGASHPRHWRRPELYGARPVIEQPGRLVRVGQGCRLAGRLHADGSEPPQLQAAYQKYRSVALLKVGSGAWMAVPFALAAKLPGQRQPELACAAFTSDRRKCLSMSMLERPVLHVDVVIEALGLDEHRMTSAHRLFSGQLIEARRRCPRLRYRRWSRRGSAASGPPQLSCPTRPAWAG